LPDFSFDPSSNTQELDSLPDFSFDTVREPSGESRREDRELWSVLFEIGSTCSVFRAVPAQSPAAISCSASAPGCCSSSPGVEVFEDSQDAKCVDASRAGGVHVLVLLVARNTLQFGDRPPVARHMALELPRLASTRTRPGGGGLRDTNGVRRRPPCTAPGSGCDARRGEGNTSGSVNLQARAERANGVEGPPGFSSGVPAASRGVLQRHLAPCSTKTP